MNRRTFLRSASGGSLILPLMAASSTSASAQSRLGVASTSYMSVCRPQDTLEFLEHCHALGAAGIQASIHGDPRQLRARAKQFGMYIEAMVPLPNGRDTAALENSLQIAAAAGAVALRSACLPTRRYETFTSLAEWRNFVGRSHASLEAALPVLEKYKIPLGIENHKDWTADEMAALMQKFSCEYLGACLDFGNNIALLDDPYDAVDKLAPYTVCTHLKNMGVEPYADGFLLSEVLLADGFLDLPRMIHRVREARPNVNFSLEMITRDPLRVPCLTDRYWITFPDRNGLYLARTLKLVEREKSKTPLPRISDLPHNQQLRIEDQNVAACLNYARDRLEL